MIRSAAATIIVVVTAGLYGVGCGDVDVPDHPAPIDHRGGEETDELRIQAKDVKFSPPELTAQTGVTSELTLENLDEVEHDFQIDEIDVDVTGAADDQGEHGGGHASADLSVHRWRRHRLRDVRGQQAGNIRVLLHRHRS
jgi:cupredoxin-like protein